MKQVMLIAAVIMIMAGCGGTERRTVDGVDCVIAKDGLGELQAVSCDWGDR